MRIYLAAPIVGVSEEDKNLIQAVKETLEYEGYEVYDPKEHGVPNAWGMTMEEWGRCIFALDTREIDSCEWMVVCDFGRDMKSGTAWECGYAFGTEKNILQIMMRDDADYSVMLRGASTNFCPVDKFLNIPLEEFFVRRGDTKTCEYELN